MFQYSKAFLASNKCPNFFHLKTQGQLSISGISGFMTVYFANQFSQNIFPDLLLFSSIFSLSSGNKKYIIFPDNVEGNNDLTTKSMFYEHFLIRIP